MGAAGAVGSRGKEHIFTFLKVKSALGLPTATDLGAPVTLY